MAVNKNFVVKNGLEVNTKLILADATNIIAEGEVLQLMNCNDPDTTEESYMQVILCMYHVHLF